MDNDYWAVDFYIGDEHEIVAMPFKTEQDAIDYCFKQSTILKKELGCYQFDVIHSPNERKFETSVYWMDCCIKLVWKYYPYNTIKIIKKMLSDYKSQNAVFMDYNLTQVRYFLRREYEK